MANQDTHDTEMLIDNYMKEISYDKLYQRLHKDILDKVLQHINDTQQNITERKRKKEKNLETEELISNLQSEVKFLREEVREKNDLIKLLSQNQQKAFFDVSQDLLNKSQVNLNHFNEVNDPNEISITHENSTNDICSQLTTVRKEKHLKYTEFIAEKKVIDSDLLQKQNLNKKTVLIVGDSMLNGIEENRISNEKFDVDIKYYSGAKVCDIIDKTNDIVKKKPDCLILHVGTNNAPNNSSNEIIDELLSLKHGLEKQSPSTKIIISTPITRTDNGKAALTVRNVNKHLNQLVLEIVDNKNITNKDLGKKGLHLSKTGKIKFAKNIKSKLLEMF